MAFVDTPSTRGVQGVQDLKVNVVLAAACTQGDLLAYAGGWILAVSALPAGTGLGAVPALVAGQAGASGDNIAAYPVARVRGFTGATPGDSLYVSPTTPGGYTTTVPGTPRCVGRMVSDTTGIVNLLAAAGVGLVS